MTTKERPILFSAPMVRAILNGNKTQTRRVLKSWERYADWTHAQPAMPEFSKELPGADESSWLLQKEKGPLVDMLWQPVGCPYGKPHDRLWVRETHYLVRAQGKPDGQVIEIDYKADPSHTIRMCPQKWRPSIHMPRWASRILLEIVSVRMERLNDISEADAEAEGIERIPSTGSNPGPNRFSIKDGDGWTNFKTAVNGFEYLWESINGVGSWQANPWVWVVDFKRIDAESGTCN